VRERFVAGNWKMHGSLVENKALLEGVLQNIAGLQGVLCGVAVPYPYLFQAQFTLQGSNVMWGAQNVSQHEKGAYTGEVSLNMLKDFGCAFVIVGHSERRSLYGESDDLVATKFAAVHAAGLVPILCVGETLEEREQGITEEVIARQMNAVLDRVGVEAFMKAVVAYEPVWAIGTGKTATPQQAQDVHAFIRGLVASRDANVAQGLIIQYGGSVKAANAAELFAMPDIDGGLVGGASLNALEFVSICKAAQR
jgi:triosephosphate isomerase